MAEIQISLAAARVNAGFTQAEVAKRLHISSRTILNWENGVVKIPFISLKVLSELYNIPMENIFLSYKST